MAVAFDANATSDVTANGVTSITTSNLTVGSGSNRALIAQILWSGTISGITLNWDQTGTPQALAQVPGATATNTVRGEIWGLVAPTAGAKQLKAQWTTSRDVVLNQLSYTGVNQTGGATSFPNGTSATGSGSPDAVTITSAVNNAVVACFANTAGNYNTPNNTQTFVDNNPANMSTAGNRAVGAASVSMSVTLSGSPASYVAVGCDIAASTGTNTSTQTGTLSFSGSLSKTVIRANTATLSFSGAIAKKTIRTNTGTLSFSGAIAKQINKGVAGTLSFTGNITRQINKSLTGVLSFSGSVSKLISRALSGALSFVGSLSTGGGTLYTIAFTATLDFVGNMSKQTRKSFTGILGMIGSGVGADIIIVGSKIYKRITRIIYERIG